MDRLGEAPHHAVGRALRDRLEERARERVLVAHVGARLLHLRVPRLHAQPHVVHLDGVRVAAEPVQRGALA
eukprot:1886929-Prymnesium_polylepis.1